MYTEVDLYAKVRRAVMVEAMSERAAAGKFCISRKTVSKMVNHAVPPGYQLKDRPVADAKTVVAEPKRLWPRCRHTHQGVIADRIIRTDTAHIRTSRRLNGRFRHCSLLGIPFAQRSKPLRRVWTNKFGRQRLDQSLTRKPGSCRLDAPCMKLGQHVIQFNFQGKVMTRVQRVHGHVARVVQDETVLTQRFVCQSCEQSGCL